MPVDRPLGEPVEFVPVPVPRREILAGRHVILRPLDAEADAKSLYAVSHTPDGDPAIWTYLFEGPYESADDMRADLRQAEHSSDPLFFTVVPLPEDRPCGVASYLRMEPEFGVIEIKPGEVCVIPRGVLFRVELPGGPARAYVCENYGGGFTLPDRGPIGANCLANRRDFETPVAAYEDRDAPCTLFVKWGGELYRTDLDHSPLDVVAWHGNYAPYKYDLRRFSPVGAVLFDHPDPSIFTCLTSPSETHGTANIDFVLFPERWSVAENTFRPPWYHRNIMSEFMGLVYGVYDAKPEGFVPGGMSLHNMMLPHGPDSDAFRHASQAELKPVKLTNTLAFMFESRFRQRVTKYAATSDARQDDYVDCWAGLKKHFDPGRRDV